MKIIQASLLSFVPASHENKDNPGAVKKVLITDRDGLCGTVQMVNWARLLKGKTFQPHYHEDMDEVFVVVTGSAALTVGTEKAVLKKGDAVIIPANTIHIMMALGNGPCDYIAIGISKGTGGNTVVVPDSSN